MSISGGGRRRIWLAFLALTAVATLVIDLAVARDLVNRATPVSVGEAVARFRAATTDPPATPPTTATLAPAANVAATTAATPGPALRVSRSTSSPHATTATPTSASAPAATAAPSIATTPADAGVYSYATTGSESVTVLGGAHHTYPSTTEVALTLTSCGYDLLWEPIEQRREEFDLCDSNGTIDVAALASFHDFFGQAKTDTYQCQRLVLRPARIDAAAGGTCTGPGGSISMTGSAVGVDTLHVGTKTIQAMHIHVAGVLTGPNHGSRVVDVWFAVGDLNGPELRYVSATDIISATPVGPTHYVENVTLNLDSLVPAR